MQSEAVSYILCDCFLLRGKQKGQVVLVMVFLGADFQPGDLRIKMRPKSCLAEDFKSVRKHPLLTSKMRSG